MAFRYECDCCGACCKSLIIEVYELDLLREPRLKEHVKPFVEPGLDGEVGMLTCGKPCPLLQADNRCSIYPTRPTDCVAMQAGDEQCQESRKRCGLPPLAPVGFPDCLADLTNYGNS